MAKSALTEPNASLDTAVGIAIANIGNKPLTFTEDSNNINGGATFIANHTILYFTPEQPAILGDINSDFDVNARED